MKIAIISLYLPYSSKIGVGYQAHGLANTLAQRGHQVTVISPCPPPPDARYEVLRISTGSRLRTFQFAFRLRAFNYHYYDILHAFTDDYCLKRTSKRYLPFHLRTLLGSCLSEARYIPGLKEKIRMLLLAFTEQVAVRVADEAVTISKVTSKHFGPCRRVVPCGVNTERFHPDGAKSSQPTVLFVGTLGWRKRGWIVLKAFRDYVQSSYPNAELWMVCEDAVESDKVRVFSRISEEYLAELYRRAWVLCSASSYEGFGVPYIEAMASGTPIISTPNAGAIKVLQNGRLGWIVKPEALGPALVQLLTNDRIREQMAVLGLQVAPQYDWNRIAAIYETIYQAGFEKHAQLHGDRRP